MLVLKFFVSVVSLLSVKAGPATESFRNQYCTDPRTMKRHNAYTEWADAYSCTRHRCQPGGRNLAIYTVGCKRVEPPESAIECEEVVEDTNMQFPFCCLRLRCLVVVRGEVWTRVLGQPWETLPAAPWSHMYKMKKPPPPDSSFLPKTGEGPVYELAEDNNQRREPVLRALKKATTENPENCKDLAAISNVNSAPDIVIALATSNDKKETRKLGHLRRELADEAPDVRNDLEFEEHSPSTENKSKSQQITWTEIPPSQWNEHELSIDVEAPRERNSDRQDYQQDMERNEMKSPNLQALVDAIGNRMRDIEHVVQKMSQNVHRNKPQKMDVENSLTSQERRIEDDIQTSKSLGAESKDREHEILVSKSLNPVMNAESFKRAKHFHGTTESSSDLPLYVEDSNLNGYFSDVSNSILRRAGIPKEPLATYMAPVENRVKQQVHTIVANSDEVEKTKKRKRIHKKKKTSKGHKKHRLREDKKKYRNRVKSAEIEKNVVSLEDSSSVNSV